MKKYVLTAYAASILLTALGIQGLAYADSSTSSTTTTRSISSPNGCCTPSMNGNTCCSPMMMSHGEWYSSGMAGMGFDQVSQEWVKALQLTPSQNKSFKVIEDQYLKEVTPLAEASKTAHRMLMSYLGCPDCKQDEMNNLVDDYTMKKNTLLKSRMGYYFQVQRLLTPPQIERSRTFWAEHSQAKAMPQPTNYSKVTLP
jgi:hypothetical protein